MEGKCSRPSWNEGTWWVHEAEVDVWSDFLWKGRSAVMGGGWGNENAGIIGLRSANGLA